MQAICICLAPLIAGQQVTEIIMAIISLMPAQLTTSALVSRRSLSLFCCVESRCKRTFFHTEKDSSVSYLVSAIAIAIFSPVSTIVQLPSQLRETKSVVWCDSGMAATIRRYRSCSLLCIIAQCCVFSELYLPTKLTKTRTNTTSFAWFRSSSFEIKRAAERRRIENWHWIGNSSIGRRNSERASVRVREKRLRRVFGKTVIIFGQHYVIW